MRSVPSFVAILLLLFATNLASGKAKPTPSPSALKKWSPSDVSVRLQATATPKPTGPKSGGRNWSPSDISVNLQADGKESISLKSELEHLMAAGRFYREQKYTEAALEYEKCVEIDHEDFSAYLFLGFSYYHLRKFDEAEKALTRSCDLNPEDFEANYWRGLSLSRLNRPSEAAQSLAKAVEIRPNDFNANLWRGMCLVRERNFKDAASSFEEAHRIRPDDKIARLELFGCYLASNQTGKASSVYPRLLLAISGILVFAYVVWFSALLPFSLPLRDKTSPGFWFSLAWLGLFLEGQAAFLLLLASLPSLNWHETILSGAIISGLPIIVVALTGFARQPWGEPFRWNLRFGSPKLILTSVLCIIGIVLLANGAALLYGYVTNKPFPVQRTIPLIQNALQANPIVAWVGVVLVIPCVEEIIFRGLLFAAFQKFLGITGAILTSSALFVIVHVQIIGFLILFLLGLILARARLRSGSLGLPIALHALNNVIAMVVLTFLPHR